jgi:hypothetical protein
MTFEDFYHIRRKLQGDYLRRLKLAMLEAESGNADYKEIEKVIGEIISFLDDAMFDE